MRINLKAATLYNAKTHTFTSDILDEQQNKYQDPVSEKMTHGIEHMSLDGEEFSHVSSGGFTLFYYTVAKKQVPGSYLSQKIKEKVKEISDKQGYRVGSKQTKDIRETVTDELTAKAMFTKKSIPIIICHEREIMIIGTSSPSSADMAFSFLSQRKIFDGSTSLFAFEKMDKGMFWLHQELLPLLEHSEDFRVGKSGTIKTSPATESSGRLSFKNIDKSLIELKKDLSHIIDSLSIEHKTKDFTLSCRGVFSRISFGDSEEISSIYQNSLGEKEDLKAELVISGMEILDSVDAINKLLVEDE